MRRIQKKSKRKGKIQIENIDIREVLDEIGVYYTESGKNVSDGWIGTACPFCGDESNHMGINVRSKTVSCFKCGTTGTVIKYLSEELGSFNKAIEILGDAVPRELISFDEEERSRAIKVELPKNASSKITQYHAGYLESRGYDYQELMDKYNLHFCGPVGKWRNCIIVPVVKQYRMITFTSVNISDEANIRYLHLEEEKSIIPIKDYLFGIEYTDGNSCIVVEGLFDKLRIGDDAVCTFGTKVTGPQKKMLSKFNIVKILFDGDDAGRVNGDRLANELAPFCDVRLFELPDGTDPDDLDSAEVEEIKNA